MIRHTVLFKIKADIPKGEIERVFTGIVGLGDLLPGILSITGGTCYFHDKKNTNHPFTHGFSIDFQNEKARNAFLNDPTIDPIKESIVNITTDGKQGVLGFDFGEWIDSGEWGNA